MRPGSREQIPTVEEAVQEAARACDPDQRSPAVATLVESFEGDERPATVPEDLAGELRSTVAEIDPDGVEPEVAAAAATAHWLATNPSSAAEPEQAMREGARLFFSGDPPATGRRLAGRARDHLGQAGQSRRGTAAA